MRYIHSYKKFTDFKNKPNNDTQKFEKKYYNLGKNINLFQTGLIKESSDSERLILEHLDHKSLDQLIVDTLHKSINESIENQKYNDYDKLHEFNLIKGVQNLVNKASKAVYSTVSSIGTGIVKIGKSVYNTVAEFVSDSINIFKKIWNAAVKFFKWFWNSIVKQIPTFLKKLMSNLTKTPVDKLTGAATLIFSSQTESESKNLKEELSLIRKRKENLDNGIIQGFDKEDVEKEATEKAKEVTHPDMKSDEWEGQDDSKDKNESKVTKKQMNYLYQSYKGLISQNKSLTTTYINELIENGDMDSINEGGDQGEGPKKKGVVEWIVEILGYLLTGPMKLKELLIKMGVNGGLHVLSGFARGLSKAFKYIKFGAIAALVYHVVTGASAIWDKFDKYGITLGIGQDHSKDHKDHDKDHDKDHGKDHGKDHDKDHGKDEKDDHSKTAHSPDDDKKAGFEKTASQTSKGDQEIDSTEVDTSKLNVSIEEIKNDKLLGEVAESCKKEATDVLAAISSKLLGGCLKAIFPTFYIVIEMFLVAFGSLELLHFLCESKAIQTKFGNNAVFKNMKALSDVFHNFIVWLPKAICNYVKSGSEESGKVASNK